MYVEIPFSVALERHSKFVSLIMDKLECGVSKERGSAPETLEWGYEWGLSVNSCTLGQMLKGEVPVETRTLEERIHCYLVASKRRWWGHAGGTLGFHPVPEEVMALSIAMEARKP